MKQHIRDVVTYEKSRRRNRTVDQANKDIMNKWGLSEDQYVYRYVDPKFVDLQNKTARGNPNSIARLDDDHSPDSISVNTFFGDRYLTPETFSGFKTMIETSNFDNNSIINTKSVYAKSIGPGLNVSSEPIEGYSGTGRF